MLREAHHHVPQHRAVQVMFDVGEPMSRAHDGRALPDHRIGQPYAVRRRAILDVLLHRPSRVLA
jgi:hypothetical protein